MNDAVPFAFALSQQVCWVARTEGPSLQATRHQVYRITRREWIEHAGVGVEEWYGIVSTTPQGNWRQDRPLRVPRAALAAWEETPPAEEPTHG